MPVYDCTFVLSSQSDEAGLEAQVKSAKDIVERFGGKIVSDNRIGMRRLAYEINKLTQGYYVSLVFEGTGEVIRELEREFRMSETCLRFLTCAFQEFGPRDERLIGRWGTHGGGPRRHFDRGEGFEGPEAAWGPEEEES